MILYYQSCVYSPDQHRLLSPLTCKYFTTFSTCPQLRKGKWKERKRKRDREREREREKKKTRKLKTNVATINFILWLTIKIMEHKLVIMGQEDKF